MTNALGRFRNSCVLQLVAGALAIAVGLLELASPGIENSLGLDARLYATLFGGSLDASGLLCVAAAAPTLAAVGAGLDENEVTSRLKRHRLASLAGILCALVAGAMVLCIMYDSGLAMAPTLLVVASGLLAIVRANRVLEEL